MCFEAKRPVVISKTPYFLQEIHEKWFGIKALKRQSIFCELLIIMQAFNILPIQNKRKIMQSYSTSLDLIIHLQSILGRLPVFGA